MGNGSLAERTGELTEGESRPLALDLAGAAEIPRISVTDLRKSLASGRELALLDMRETGLHAREGHIFLSSSLPLSRAELEAPALLPRRTAELVLYDDGSEDLAEQAALRLRDLGYSRISILAGGTRAWAEAGGELFTGLHMVGIAFGEFAAHHYNTPHITARALKRLIDAGEKIQVIDNRPEEEFRNFSIPGALDLPGAELLYRFHQAVPDPDTRVVINCAGRTRSIIGAQSLINAGVAHEVVALAGGTMDWLTEGYALDHGRAAPPVSPASLTEAAAQAAALRQRFEIEEISLAQLAAFRAEEQSGARSCYLFDIRSEAEYRAGHFPGSAPVAGGQLVQQINRWVGIRNARIVLVDEPDGLRAAITASWLKQINWGEVFILKDGLSGPVETGPAPILRAQRPGYVPGLTPAELAALQQGQKLNLIDVASSERFRAGHIPGARFAIRSRLREVLSALPADAQICVTSEDGELAAYAAADLARIPGLRVFRLEGGTAAWIAAGGKVETGATEDLPWPADDVCVNRYHLPEPARQAAFRQYLDWELGLMAQLEREETMIFRRFPPA